RREILLDPGNGAAVGFLGAGEIVEQADRGNGVVGGVENVVAHETPDIADDGDGAFLDPAVQLFGLAGLGFPRRVGAVHAVLLPLTVPADCNALASASVAGFYAKAGRRTIARALAAESSLQFDLAQSGPGASGACCGFPTPRA